MHNCQFSFLQHEALLHLTGPDSLTFLQGQTTCDTRQVDPEHAVPGVYCTPQGRVVCDFLLSQLGQEHYTLRMRRTAMTHAAAVFGKYIVFSKADLDPDRQDWQVAGVWGAEAATAITEAFGVVPKGQYGSALGAGFNIIQLDGEGQRFECHVDNGACAEQLESLATKSQAALEEQWQLLDIRSGIARIEAPLIEEFVPQTLNYDRTGHISFSKGCYTGQEVVARLHYRGTPKRRTFIAQLPDTANAAEAAELYAATGKNAVGNLVNPVMVDGQLHGLAAATLDGAASGLHLGKVDGPRLTLQEPPYPFADEG